MKRLLHLLINSIAVGAMFVMLFGVWPHSIIEVEGSCSAIGAARLDTRALPFAGSVGRVDVTGSGLELAFDLSVRIPNGSLGLPGEPVTWVITLVNNSSIAGTDVMITDKLRGELQIESIDVAQGDVAVSEQMIVYTLPEIGPQESVILTINTTVLNGPLNGQLVNEAALVINGPHGTISRIASTEVYVPSGLPATGYPPVPDAPVNHGLPFSVMALIAMGVIGATAFFVYQRGRRA